MAWSNWIDVGGYKYYSKEVGISEGKWSGVTLSDSSWVALTTDNIDSSFIYYHNLNLDVSKIVNISASVYEPDYYIRQGRGADTSGNTLYRFFPHFDIHGDINYSELNYSPVGGGTIQQNLSNNNVSVGQIFDQYNGRNSNSNNSYIVVDLYSNYIQIRFQYGESNVPLALHSTTPKFRFSFVYK